MKQHQGYIYIATTLDTKSDELFYVCDLIKETGLSVRTVDLTTQPTQLKRDADVSAQTVASFHPAGVEAVFCGDRGRAIEAMSLAFSLYLNAQTDVAAILGLGGSGGTALITPRCRHFPLVFQSSWFPPWHQEILLDMSVQVIFR